MKQRTFKPINTAWLLPLFFYTVITAHCSSAYKSLKPIAYESNCILKFKPTFTRALYNTQVNVLKHHLSGLLLIKQMPDSSTRIFFSMETGFKFFDFEFDKNGDFKVHYIIDKMNRKPVINTLRKDFELALMINVIDGNGNAFTKDGLLYHQYKNENAFDYYITDTSCTKLVRIEKATERKTKTSIIMQGYLNGMPDTIGITHYNIKFNIGLKRLETIKQENSNQE